MLQPQQLRYLAIFLFVLHAAGMVLLSYRFAGIDSKIPLALPWLELGLIRFGTIIIFASILIGFVMGLSVRSSGGLDLAGTVDYLQFLVDNTRNHSTETTDSILGVVGNRVGCGRQQ